MRSAGLHLPRAPPETSDVALGASSPQPPSITLAGNARCGGRLLPGGRGGRAIHRRRPREPVPCRVTACAWKSRDRPVPVTMLQRMALPFVGCSHMLMAAEARIRTGAGTSRPLGGRDGGVRHAGPGRTAWRQCLSQGRGGRGQRGRPARRSVPAGQGREGGQAQPWASQATWSRGAAAAEGSGPGHGRPAVRGRAWARLRV